MRLESHDIGFSWPFFVVVAALFNGNSVSSSSDILLFLLPYFLFGV